jgi:hypothetical protein
VGAAARDHRRRRAEEAELSASAARRFHRYAVYQVLLYAKYKHVSGKRYVLDTYPLRRSAQALASIPRCAASLLRRDPAPASAALLQLIEAAGVFCGGICGAIRFRQPYL